MSWLYLACAPVLSLPAAWWLGRRRYRLPDDSIHTTAPAWLLPLITAVATVLASPFFVGRSAVEIITYSCALVWGGLLAFIDLDVRRLPDLLTLPAYPACAVLLAACSAVTGDWAALARAAACAGIAVAVFLAIALLAAGSGGIGLGDVKLVGVLGALLGWQSWYNALLGLVTGCILAGLQAGVLLISRRADRRSFVAYGPALIVGGYLWAALPPPT